MKRRVVGGLSVALLLLGAACLRGQLSVTAQEPQRASAAAPLKVAVFDLEEVLKDNARMKRESAEIQADAKQANNELNVRREELIRVGQKLEKMAPGSDAQQQLNRQAIKLQMALKTDTDELQLKFAEREAQLYSAVYAEIEREVERYAEKMA